MDALAACFSVVGFGALHKEMLLDAMLQIIEKSSDVLACWRYSVRRCSMKGPRQVVQRILAVCLWC